MGVEDTFTPINITKDMTERIDFMGCVELFEYEMVLIEKELEKVNKRLAELKEINKCYEDN